MEFYNFCTYAAKGKGFPEFDISFAVIRDEAVINGLDDDVLERLMDVIIHTDLQATKWTFLIQCLIPKKKLPDEILKSMMAWCLSSLNKLPINVSTIVIQWVIGLWEYKLADRKIINIFYDALFYRMLKKKQLERNIARLIYVLAKPEDVCRRDVNRLLTLQKNYSKPQKHIIALLSLFKSYKPELVPEKIQSVNIESVWKPIPESIRLPLENTKDRIEDQQFRQNTQACFDWHIVQKTKTSRIRKAAVVPSLSYFRIGSSIFKDEDAKSIFDINNIEELGKYHHCVELPCNVVSLLANTAGYHLLTFADLQFQSRFSYNLYNTLTRAFILENEIFSEEEKNKLLTMTFEFSRYMQEGIPVIKLFFNEYLYYNTGKYLPQLFNLLQWMTSVSIEELKENILPHIQNIFDELDLDMKCEVIKSLRELITNLFIKQGLEKEYQNRASPFLRQRPLENLIDIIPVLTTVTERLIVYGLNLHNYNIILLSEALTFYEEISKLEDRTHTALWTLPPSAVIYGAFVTTTCATLSRLCQLLLRYRKMSSWLCQIMARDLYKKKVDVISTYAHDIYRALWLNEPFSARENGDFLRTFSQKVIDDLEDCDLNSLLSINCHYAVLVYKYTLNQIGLNISTKEDAAAMALHYYTPVNEFIATYDILNDIP